MGSQNHDQHEYEACVLENGGNIKGILSKEIMKHGRTAHNMSSSSLRKKSDITLVSKLHCGIIRNILANFQEVILGTKLSILFPTIPFAILAQCYGFARVSIYTILFKYM
jgi:Ca2+:H+ antiporter